jgi:hypothetical protein
MALWSDKKEFIFKAVDEMYTEVASHPDTVFHFPTGRSALPVRWLSCQSTRRPAGRSD